LLAGSALVVEGDDVLGSPRHIRHDEPDAGASLARMPFDLGDNPARPLPTSSLMAEARIIAAHFIRRASCRTSWAEFADAIFARSVARGGPTARVRPIATSENPTPAARPANSRLATAKLQRIHGVAPRDWRGELNACVDRLVERGA